MPLKIIRQDITKMECDAIVNPTNCYLEAGGGTDLAVHKAAGRALDEYCRKIGGCPVGTAVLTPAFNLPCKYIIHTAGPDWYAEKNAKSLLISCYQSCLKIAAEEGFESIAMPLISSGTYGYPKDKVLQIATAVISAFLMQNEMTVYLLVFDKASYDISRKLFFDITTYIDDNYAAVHSDDCGTFSISGAKQSSVRVTRRIEPENTDFCQSERLPMRTDAPNFDDLFQNMDKGFAETLFAYIDRKGITDVECYKKSNVDKKTFSKIKCNKDYRPSKLTAVSFAIGLRLNLDETNHLLSTVGMCLSHANKFDVIIEYFVKTGNYKDVFEVNEVLYKFDQPLLGV